MQKEWTKGKVLSHKLFNDFFRTDGMSLIFAKMRKENLK
jgi:hypothetical protein